MSQRAYCDLPHPGGDAEADRWCIEHHRPAMPRINHPSAPGWTPRSEPGCTCRRCLIHDDPGGCLR